MPVSPLVAGVDCSTQSTKVVLVDPDGGHIVASGHTPHTVTGEVGWTLLAGGVVMAIFAPLSVRSYKRHL